MYLVSWLHGTASEEKRRLCGRGAHLQQQSPGRRSSLPSAICNHIAGL